MSVFIVSIFKLVVSLLSGGFLYQGFVPSHHASLVRKVVGVIIFVFTVLMCFKDEIKDYLSDDEVSKAEQMYWDSVEKHPSAEAYRIYLNKYPEGTFVDIARIQLNKYEKTIRQPLPLLYLKPIVADEWQMIEQYQVKNGLVKDTKTGLMWMRCSIGQNWGGFTCQGKATEYTWDDAMQIPKNFEYAGYRNWRVPTIKEFKTLFYCKSGIMMWNMECKNNNYGHELLSVNELVFPNVPIPTGYFGFWSSSYHQNDIYGYYFDFRNNNIYSSIYTEKNNKMNVRLVRSGQ
jgi:uncharacterized protein (TIGR02145 family)